MPGVREHVRTTCPRDCYDGCGIVVVKRAGRITKVLGDPEHPVSRGALCAKCALAYNGVFRDEAARLTRPLRRVGAKGEGRFAPIPWDEALDEIAERLAAVPPESVVYAHYTGTCSLIAGSFPERFFNRLGATEVDPDTICNNAGHVALGYVLGTSTTGFDPRSARDARAIVVWGANPSATAPHAHKHWLKESRTSVAVIDPVRHPTAAAADHHLRPRPGSDAALAFALLHVIAREGLVDEAFVAEHVLGWDEMAPLVAGCDRAWGERATGVPAAAIEAVARLYAEGPSLLWLGQGLQRQPRGGNVMRAAVALAAVTGHIGKPGAGVYYLNGGASRGIDGAYLAGESLRRADARRFSQMELAARLEDPALARAFVTWNINPLASSPEQARLRRALAREDLFTVVIDLFQTDTADYADIVLPAASFLEFDDLVVPYFHLLLSAQVKAAEPPAEALPNQEIFRRLAARMGFTEAPLFEADEAIIARLLEGSGLGLDFAELARRGSVPVSAEPAVPFADGRFPTPSGRIELASAAAQADGHPRTPEPWVDPPPAAGALRLLSPASPWLMNDSYANDPRIAERLGPATVTLNPVDAERLGLAAGDRVRLANATGALVLRLAVADLVPPGTAYAPKGRWPKLEGANVNVLNPGIKSDMGESTSVHGVEVTVARA